MKWNKSHDDLMLSNISIYNLNPITQTYISQWHYDTCIISSWQTYKHTSIINTTPGERSETSEISWWQESMVHYTAPVHTVHLRHQRKIHPITFLSHTNVFIARTYMRAHLPTYPIHIYTIHTYVPMWSKYRLNRTLQCVLMAAFLTLKT